MKNLGPFVFVLALVFAAPWLLLIACPYSQLTDAESAEYDPKIDKVDPESLTMLSGAFGPTWRGQALRGAEIYAANGCAYCHTQMIRPTDYAGTEGWRAGWAGRAEENLARSTRPQDYTGETYAHLGIARLGPDLSNYGYRASGVDEIYMHLYDPYEKEPHSVMPSYRNLFSTRKIEGERSLDALDVELDCDEADQWEVVPNDKAKALAAYLLSMKKDAKVPESLAGGAAYVD
ncbi:MAG: cytochrome c oxidase cbb3-type subunit 2 [Verrucomicrobiales bacterium]|jgi:cytochrome c oxidase cbb3-type subunit 2